MAGERLEVVQRNDAWISVLSGATEVKHGSAAEGSTESPDGPPPIVAADLTADDVEGLVGHDPVETAPSHRRWSVLSLLTLVAGVGALLTAGYSAMETYFPEVSDIRGVDGKPPAILSQPDTSSNPVSDYGSRVLEWSTSWPYILAAPIVLAALIGLLAGWVRWRMGRSRAAERSNRELQREATRLVAQTVEQSLRIEALDRRCHEAKDQVVDLTGRLESAGVTADQSAKLRTVLEERDREVRRLTTDLEDALTERDTLENACDQLSARLAQDVENSAAAASAVERLRDSEEMVQQQRTKIDSLEQHLDQVRRRTSEMAQEVRAADQLRSAWNQAEEVIADLTVQLSDAEEGRLSYQPQTAASIVAGNSRVEELELLLNEAADVIESVQNQLRQTRFQLSERDAAIARADVRAEALQTEVELLTAEIEQAAYTIASLSELPDQRRRSDSIVTELRSALTSERDRTADLERQLRAVTARALRLEERMIGDRSGSDRVLDLTETTRPTDPLFEQAS